MLDGEQKTGLQIVLCSTEDDAAAIRRAGFKSVRAITEAHSIYVGGEGPDGFAVDPSLALFDRIVLAFRVGDEDLRDALAARLGDLRCTQVTYDPDIEFNELVTLARPMWLDEVCTLDDVPDSGEQKSFASGLQRLDEHGFRLIRPAFMVCVGPYGSGKSVLLRQLACNLYKLHGWRTLITAFEEKIKPRYVRDLRRHLIDRHFHLWTPADVAKADENIRNGFRFLRRKRNTLLDADRLLDRIEFAVKRYGVDVVIIDPFNEIDHQIGRTEMKTDYIGRVIMRLKQMADDYNLLMIVAAHPPKDGTEKKNVKGRMLTLNDAADSAHFGNKADIGWCVWRPVLDGPSYLHIDKLKDHEYMGSPTLARLDLDKGLGRFNVTRVGYDIFAEIE